jgi:hypothetical protein
MMPAKRKQTGRTKKTERLSLAPLTPEDALKKMLGAPVEKAPQEMVPRAKPKPEKGK